jgi:CRAL/TRIO domain
MVSSCYRMHNRKGKDRTSRIMLPDGDRLYATQNVLRCFSILMDGLNRATLLPQGPQLVRAMVYGSVSSFQILHWGRAALSLSLVMSVRLMSGYAGTFLGRTYVKGTEQMGSLPLIARLGGLVILLFYVATSGCSTTLHWLAVTCFLSSLLAGFMLGVTSPIDISHEQLTRRGTAMFEDASSTLTKSDPTVATAKLRTMGYSLSVLLQYLWLPDLSRVEWNEQSTQTTLSAVTFVGGAVLLEIFFRFVLKSCSSAHEQFGHEKNPSMARTRLGSINTSNSGVHDGSEIPQVSFSGFPLTTQFNNPIDKNSSNPSSRGRGGSFGYAASVRSRVESSTSVDEYFDCRSVLSDFDDVHLVDEEAAFSQGSTELAIYCNNRCVFGDGRGAYVPPGESPCCVPSTYVTFHGGNQGRARAAWEETQRWRLEKRVWRIHTLPNPWFAKIKHAYPHFVHGHSKAGFPIIYEQPGQMDLKRLFLEGCQVEDMLYCYTFFMEFVSNVICTKDEVRAKLGPNPPSHGSSTWGIMVVMDVKGAGLSHLSGNVARYVKSAGDINSAHYPMSMKRAFVINAPFWLGGAWSGIKGLLPDSVQVDILSERMYPSALREYIDEDQIPPEYGGTSSFSLGQHPYEVELRQLVDRVAQVDETDDAPEPDWACSRADATMPLSSGSDDRVNALQSGPVAASAFLDDAKAQPLRRRVHSVDRTLQEHVNDMSWKGHGRRYPSTEARRFAVATLLLGSYHALEGVAELCLPFWILSPASVGGLGYEPPRSCVVMFCSSFVLLCLTRRAPFGAVLRLPHTFPLKALRVATGLESLLLAALALATLKVPEGERASSALLTAATILVLSTLVMASATGRAAVGSLHGRSALDLAGRAASTSSSFPSWLVALLESGQSTFMLALVSETAGILFGAPLLCWCFSGLSPLYASSALLLISWCQLLVYAFTFSPAARASLKNERESPSHPRKQPRRNHRCGCLPILSEAVAVSTGDVASLMEEGHWCSTPILHPDRRRPPAGDPAQEDEGCSRQPSTRIRSFSDTSLFTDPAMDGGDDLATNDKAK